jgi:hypothetical protein
MHLTTWTVALELDKPGDVWMVELPSSDWSKTPKQQRDREDRPSGLQQAPGQRAGGDLPVQVINPPSLQIRVFTPAVIQVITRLFFSGLYPTFDLRRLRRYSSF